TNDVVDGSNCFSAEGTAFSPGEKILFFLGGGGGGGGCLETKLPSRSITNTTCLIFSQHNHVLVVFFIAIAYN
ncbi:hypothetical protein ACJX0J_005971, partial [Zea mays]